MSEDLKSVLADMSQFISVEVGEGFSGYYRGFKRVPNRFDADKEALEFTFEVNGSEKTMTSMSLPRFLVEANVQEGDYVLVRKISKKGTAIIWDVTKQKAPAGVMDEQKPVQEGDLKDAGL